MPRIPRQTAACACLTVLLSSAPALAAVEKDPVQAILNQKQLQTAYNPVLLGFLLEEGKRALAEKQRKQAIDQLVAGLLATLQTGKGEQIATNLVTAGALLLGGDVGEALSEVSSEIWGTQLDSAVILRKAGYTEPAVSFFEHCLQVFPSYDVQARCAAELVTAKPEQAYTLLLGYTDKKHATEVVNRSLELLGELAAAPGTPQQQKDAIFQTLTERTKGVMNNVHYLAAANGLIRSRDPRAVEPLKSLTKGMLKDEEVKRAAMRGLLLTFGDRSPVEQLQKMLKKGGLMNTNDGYDRYFAGTLLIEADEEAGYAWALESLTPKKKKKGLGKLMSMGKGKDQEPDLAADVVRTLVRKGGDRARQVLAQAVALEKQDEWLRAWIAIGLLELGDASRIDLARSSLTEYLFTALRAATALAKHEDYSGIPVLETLAGLTVQHDKAEAVLSFLAGEGRQYRNKQEARERRLARLRRQIADALADIDHASGVPILVRLLDDEYFSVRLRAAYALARMTDPAALDGLARALRVDYGKPKDGASRNPQVQAHLLRSAARNFPGEARTRTLLQEGRSLDDAAARFLALAALGSLGKR